MLAWLVGVYSTVIVIRVLVSWIRTFTRRNQYNGFSYSDPNQNPSVVDTVDEILGKIADPYLGLFTRVTSLRRGSVDFTPLLALVMLNLAKSILSIIAQAGSITLWLVLAIIVRGLWTVISFVMVFMLILLVIRFFVGRGNGMQTSGMIDFLDPILDIPVGKVYKVFYRKKGQVDDQKLVLTSLIVYFILYLVLNAVETGLVNLLLSL